MALVKYGGGIVQMSGSIAGNTFARNRYGNYNRARTIPVNPNSSRQQSIRGVIINLAEEWHETLTDANRAAWEVYAAAVNMTNRLGETINLTGFNHFVRSNAARAYCGNPGQIDQGPATLSLADTDETLVAAPQTDQTVDYTYDDTMDWCSEDGAQMMIFCGHPQLATRNFFAGPWRYATRIVGNSGSPPSSPSEGNAMPWTFQAGQAAWFKARISRADGRLSSICYMGPYTFPSV